MKSVKKGKVDTKNYSRGVAFVEFLEHQHALVALRVLNNNPGDVYFVQFVFFIYTFAPVSIFPPVSVRPFA